VTPLQNAALDQLAEAIGQDIAGNAETGLELLEMLEPVEGAAQDQEGPFLTDQLYRRRQWAAERGCLESFNVRFGRYGLVVIQR
jgi:hypothetical protein